MTRSHPYGSRWLGAYVAAGICCALMFAAPFRARGEAFPAGETGSGKTSVGGDGSGSAATTTNIWFTMIGANDTSGGAGSSDDQSGASVYGPLVAIPEPGTMVTIMSGIGMLLMLRRRHRT